MGQYYIAAFIAPNADPNNVKEEDIIGWKCPSASNTNGMKLMEHSYIKNSFMTAVEGAISPMGLFYKYRLIWAGDYADNELCGKNIYMLAQEQNHKMYRTPRDVPSYRFIVNHTKKLYLDKDTLVGESTFIIHPLSLLTSDGNGRGGGDYRGKGEDMCGAWMLDSISMETTFPEGYKEFHTPFDLYD